MNNPMRASVYSRYGSPEVLSISELPIPRCGTQEVLIKVKASTVNRTDCAMLTAKPFIMRFFTGFLKPKNKILGTDFAGEIVDIGDEVSGYKIGDKVFGFNDLGVSSHAEYLTLSQDAIIIHMPKKCSYIQAAGLCEGAHYAYNCLNKLTIRSGQKVFVNGGTGAIGSALIQILKSQGAIIKATARTAHIDIVKGMGVDEVIDYTKVDFTTLQEKFDIFFDVVGKSTYGKCKRLLTKKGIYISSELGPYIQNIPLALITPLFGGRKVVFPIPSDVEKSLLFIKGLFEKGEFDAMKDKEFKLENIAAAFSYALTGKKVGNVFVNHT